MHRNTTFRVSHAWSSCSTPFSRVISETWFSKFTNLSFKMYVTWQYWTLFCQSSRYFIQFLKYPCHRVKFALFLHNLLGTIHKIMYILLYIWKATAWISNNYMALTKCLYIQLQICWCLFLTYSFERTSCTYVSVVKDYT